MTESKTPSMNVAIIPFRNFAEGKLMNTTFTHVQAFLIPIVAEVEDM